MKSSRFSLVENLKIKIGLELPGIKISKLYQGKEGIRFTSIHTAKKQKETFLYSRGKGAVRPAV